MSWTLQVAASGGTYRNFTLLTDVNFIDRLNGLGFFGVVVADLEGLAAPASDELVRIVYDQGLSTERIHFEGIITDARQIEGSNMRLVKGLNGLGLLWQAKVGTIREWVDANYTPHDIVNAAASGNRPNGLLYNMAGTKIMSLGTSASVPNKVDGSNPGVAMKFRSDSGPLLLQLQRLALQAQYDNTATPTALRYGLEFYVTFEGANSSTPVLYLVRRRERASSYTAETFNIPDDFYRSRRGKEGATAADAIRVVGTGSGKTRVQSQIVGSGGIEGVIADKTALGVANAASNTNADVMANRLSALLAPDTEVITGLHGNYTLRTKLGDDVKVTETGVADATLRCFAVAYKFRSRLFSMELGRPRSLNDTSWFNISSFLMGETQSSQAMDGKKLASGQASDTRLGVGSGSVTTETTLTFSEIFNADIHEAINLKWAFEPTNAGLYDVIVQVGAQQVMRLPLNCEGSGVGAAGEITVPAARIRDDLALTGLISSANIRVKNRSGGSSDITQRLWGWLLG